jgi:Phage integrase, N-terminal SAM-like domain
MGSYRGCMAYDWRPTATRAATTDPAVVALPRRDPDLAPGLASPDDILVSAAIEDFIAAVEAGRARNRSGRRYLPSAVRDLRGILRHRVAGELGEMHLRDVRHHHVQALIDRLAAEGLSESRIRSVISAVRALYGYAIEVGWVELSPANGLVIPREDALQAPEAEEPTWEWAEQPRAAAPPEEPPIHRYKSDYQPITLLPERILSLVLRIVIVVFILFALITIAGSV